MQFRSTKTYGHDQGLSCAFRQWRAKSHCRHLHGYALAFTITFEADTLDKNGWVQDFGSLRPIKDRLCELFDHTTAVAADDPEMETFRLARDRGLLNLVELASVGCEAFAKLVAWHTCDWLLVAGHSPRVRLVSVECCEHGANSALVLM